MKTKQKIFDGKTTSFSSEYYANRIDNRVRARQIYIGASRRDRHRRKLESAANATVEGVTKGPHIGRK